MNSINILCLILLSNLMILFSVFTCNRRHVTFTNPCPLHNAFLKGELPQREYYKMADVLDGMQKRTTNDSKKWVQQTDLKLTTPLWETISWNSRWPCYVRWSVSELWWRCTDITWWRDVSCLCMIQCMYVSLWVYFNRYILILRLQKCVWTSGVANGSQWRRWTGNVQNHIHRDHYHHPTHETYMERGFFFHFNIHYFNIKFPNSLYVGRFLTDYQFVFVIRYGRGWMFQMIDNHVSYPILRKHQFSVAPSVVNPFI